MKRIVNLIEDGFVIWDTTFDAPITHILSYSEMIEEIKNFPRLSQELVDNSIKFGVSTQLVGSDDRSEQIEEIISSNRAGFDDQELTLSEIIENYKDKSYISKKYAHLLN